jgi:hypothetical protein
VIFGFSNLVRFEARKISIGVIPQNMLMPLSIGKSSYVILKRISNRLYARSTPRLEKGITEGEVKGNENLHGRRGH